MTQCPEQQHSSNLREEPAGVATRATRLLDVLAQHVEVFQPPKLLASAVPFQHKLTSVLLHPSNQFAVESDHLEKYPEHVLHVWAMSKYAAVQVNVPE